MPATAELGVLGGQPIAMGGAAVFLVVLVLLLLRRLCSSAEPGHRERQRSPLLGDIEGGQPGCNKYQSCTRRRPWHPRAAAVAHPSFARSVSTGASVVASGTLPHAVVEAAARGDASGISSWLADDRCVIDACSSLDGCTALHAAARAGHVNLVRLLLESGADALAVDSEMRTPLHHVAAAGHGICVKALLDAGSDPEGASSLHTRPCTRITGYAAAVLESSKRIIITTFAISSLS